MHAFASSQTAAAATWAIQPTPNPAGEQQIKLSGVSCGSRTICTGVGDFQDSSDYWSTLVEQWSGTSWSIESTPVPRGSYESYLQGVSCSSRSACTAVGYYFPNPGPTQMLAERWQGHRWTIERPPRPRGARDTSLEGVSCSSATACMAVGHYTIRTGGEKPLVERWNGTRWVLELPPNPRGASLVELLAVSCSSSTACTAVGDRGSYTTTTVAERWNGHRWKIERTPGHAGALRAVSCPTTNSCMAVGDSNIGYDTYMLAEQWNGHRWTVNPLPTVTNQNQTYLNGVSCASRQVCTAVGWYTPSLEEPLALRWDLGTWTMQSTPAPAGRNGEFDAVACTSASVCSAVGETNQVLAERYS